MDFLFCFEKWDDFADQKKKLRVVLKTPKEKKISNSKSFWSKEPLNLMELWQEPIELNAKAEHEK